MFFKKPKLSNLALLFMVFISGLISVYDNTLNYLTMNELINTELNPVAREIIKRWDVKTLIEIKAVSTLMAVLLMIRLIYTKWKAAIPPVCIFQIGLFFYLTCYVETGWWKLHDMFAPFRMVWQFYSDYWS